MVLGSSGRTFPFSVAPFLLLGGKIKRAGGLSRTAWTALDANPGPFSCSTAAAILHAI